MLDPHEGILRSIETRVQQDGVHSARPHPDRARQFMPFAALKGYHELARERERVSEPKRLMTEERATELSVIISRLSKGDMISVTHYEDGHYADTCGVVTEINETTRSLRVVKKPIDFDTIFSIDA